MHLCVIEVLQEVSITSVSVPQSHTPLVDREQTLERDREEGGSEVRMVKE